MCELHKIVPLLISESNREIFREGLLMRERNSIFDLARRLAILDWVMGFGKRTGSQANPNRS
jgi:hypothetical protein